MVIGVFPSKADGIAEPGESLNVQDSIAHHLILYEIGIRLLYLYKKFFYNLFLNTVWALFYINRE